MKPNWEIEQAVDAIIFNWGKNKKKSHDHTTFLVNNFYYDTVNEYSEEITRISKLQKERQQRPEQEAELKNNKEKHPFSMTPYTNATIELLKQIHTTPGSISINKSQKDARHVQISENSFC